MATRFCNKDRPDKGKGIINNALVDNGCNLPRVSLCGSEVLGRIRSTRMRLVTSVTTPETQTRAFACPSPRFPHYALSIHRDKTVTTTVEDTSGKAMALQKPIDAGVFPVPSVPRKFHKYLRVDRDGLFRHLSNALHSLMNKALSSFNFGSKS